MYNDMVTFNVMVNVVLCLIIVLCDGYCYIRIRSVDKWESALYTFVGLCWLIRYILFFCNVDSVGISHVNAVLIVVTTLTLTALAVASIIRIKDANDAHLRQDINDITKRLPQWISKKS